MGDDENVLENLNATIAKEHAEHPILKIEESDSVAKKLKKYNRHEWRLAKAWSLHDSRWHFAVQWKVKFLFFTFWNDITVEDASRCKWDKRDYPGYDKDQYGHWSDTIYFNCEAKAKEFIEFFEEYRKQWFQVQDDLANDRYIKVD